MAAKYLRSARQLVSTLGLRAHPFSISTTSTRAFSSYTSLTTAEEEAPVEERLKWDYRGQRRIMPLGHTEPYIGPDCFIAPNAVIVGHVEIFDSSSIWYGAVLRGDLNRIHIDFGSNIQEKCVIHAAKSSPTGLPAETYIDRFVSVGAYSLLRSCHIEYESIIGQRCILMEGSIVETHAILEAGTVLPPGRRIPSGELWGGNPARFIRQLSADEVAAIPNIARDMTYAAKEHFYEFLPYSTAYLEVEKMKKSLKIPLNNISL